jgi:hypothetical protein
MPVIRASKHKGRRRQIGGIRSRVVSSGKGYEAGFMPYDRLWLIDLLRSLGYTGAADDAARLPDQLSLEQLREFADQHGISRDEITDRLGGSP